MKDQMGFSLILISFSLFSLLLSTTTHGYDPLDPSGNVTIRWDILQDNVDTQDGVGAMACMERNHLFDQLPHTHDTHSCQLSLQEDGYLFLWRSDRVVWVHENQVRVSIINNQLFRHVEHPGWKLSWEWPGNEVIWDMRGAEATEQGNCSRIKGNALPHCCEKEPVIIDLLPGAPYNKQVANCCKGGELSSMTQDSDKFLAAFQMNIGSLNMSGYKMPKKFRLGLPGYTCGYPFKVPPTKFTEDNGRRRTQALATWNMTCTFSQFLASTVPRCCVSLSAFYNQTIVSCPTCSCGCQGQPGLNCVKAGELPPVLQLPLNEAPPPVVQCSQHMCPIKVHWHVKLNYKLYWRVKITITNLNYARNYSQWNLVAVHPNLSNVTQVFSFNYKPLNNYGSINNTGIFYGIQYYNDMLLQSGDKGNVQTEILLQKDPSSFTFREGWAFPRRVSFNGYDCVMPLPDEYPRLPNSARLRSPPLSCLSFSLFLVFMIF